MQIVYAPEPLPQAVRRSVFLAGPTPRTAEVASWRPAALALLAERGYDGVVFVPEPRDGGPVRSYIAQVDWELDALACADCILFWIPRELAQLPGFTTNVEFGYWARSGKCILGAPPGAPKLTYLDALAARLGIARVDSLAAGVDRALAALGDGADRRGGECQVPLDIFRTRSFQRWYGAQRAAGNVLEGARVEWVLRVVSRRFLLYWALHVRIRVAAEGRVKTNEIVLARPDTAQVVLYRRDPDDPSRSTLALVREFRSAGATGDGFVHEHCGGSSFEAEAAGDDDPRAVALSELAEEVGLRLDAARLRPIGARQLAPTMSAHRAHVFAVELDDAELATLRAQAGVVHGADAGERTTVELWTLAELLRDDRADWSTLGMAIAALGLG
jgi:8-oxo-dGTP pyrophosphatase MutT (NUDIX family)